MIIEPILGFFKISIRVTDGKKKKKKKKKKEQSLVYTLHCVVSGET